MQLDARSLSVTCVTTTNVICVFAAGLVVVRKDRISGLAPENGLRYDAALAAFGKSKISPNSIVTDTGISKVMPTKFNAVSSIACIGTKAVCTQR